VVDFLFVIIEPFRYLLRLRRYKRRSVTVGVFRRGSVTLSANFRRNRVLPDNHCWCQKTRVIALSCGINILNTTVLHYRADCDIRSALFGIVTKHACDGQTEGQTDRQTDRQTDLRVNNARGASTAARAAKIACVQYVR